MLVIRLVSLMSIFAVALIGQGALSATISGTVNWQGKVPKLAKIDMTADPDCTGKYKGKTPPVSQALALGSGNTMGNVFVSVTSGLPKGKTYKAPSAPIVVTQKGCVYSPHVFGMVKGQKVKFLNEDGILHNVHALPRKNRQFNISMPKTMKESSAKKFRKTEVAFKIKCDVHPWMQTWAQVFEHPYFKVTATDGKFSLNDLPAGTYEIEAWHEKAGTRKATVIIKDGETKSTDFTFSPPKKKK